MENKYTKILIGLFFSALGLIYILIVTNVNNLGASPDSVSYLEVSQNIFNESELNFYEDNTVAAQWPPFYPVSISIVSKITGLDSINSAKYLSAFLLFASVFVLNLIFKKFHANSFTVILLNLFFITSNALSVYLMIWSEPLFIFLLLLLCYIFLNWIESNNYLILFFSAILSGLLILTRYAGIGFVAGIILFLLLKKNSLKIKLINLILYSAVTFGIAYSWILFLYGQSPGSDNRQFTFHVISIGHLKQLTGTLLNWISPSFTRIGFVLLLFLFIIILIDLYKRKIKFHFKSADEKVNFLILILISYIVLLLFTVSFIDFHIYLENRILAPAFPILIILAIPLIEKIQKLNYIRFFYYAAMVFILISCSYSLLIRSRKFYSEGEGYTTKAWIESETISSLKKYPDAKIFTNGRDALRLLYSENKNTVYSFPLSYFPSSQKENPYFEKQIEGVKDSVESNNSILVFFDNCAWRTYYPGEEYLKKEFSNFNFDEQNDGFILHK